VEDRAYVVLMRVHLHFPEAGSLKGKRAELNRVKALLRERLHVSVAEIGHQDSWQRSTLAVAIAAGSAAGAEEAAVDVADSWWCSAAASAQLTVVPSV
jgi:uncharacterized protein YlxP (DUF503 family)